MSEATQQQQSMVEAEIESEIEDSSNLEMTSDSDSEDSSGSEWEFEEEDTAWRADNWRPGTYPDPEDRGEDGDSDEDISLEEFYNAEWTVKYLNRTAMGEQ